MTVARPFARLAPPTLVAPTLLTAMLAALTLPASTLPVRATALVRAGDHVDRRIGFELEIPSDWHRIPADAKDGWVVAKYNHKSKQFWTDPASGFTYEMTPNLRVIAFIDDIINTADLDLDDEEDEDEDGPEIELRQIFQDYRHYMRETYPQGYYEDSAETVAIDGRQVEQIVLRTGEGASDVEFRLDTWIFSTEIGKVAVQFEMFEDGYRKLRRDVSRILRSFDEVERTEPIETNPLTGMVTWAGIWKLDAEERAVRRKEMERQEWERLTRVVPDGWEADEVGGLNVLTHSDSRHTREVAENVNAVVEWLEETFPEVGPDEYARRPILRICEDYDEYRAFYDGTAFRSRATSSEIVTCKGSGGKMDPQWNLINRETLRLWLWDKNLDLYFGMPPWFDIGLEELVARARPKRSGLEFVETDMERTLSRMADRESGVRPMRELMRMRRDEFFTDDNMETGYNVGQAMKALRFFLDGAGSKKRGMRDVLPTYVGHVRDVLAEIEAREEAEEDSDEEGGDEKDDEPETEEEEEEYVRKRREERERRENEILEEAFARTFADWDERDWESLERLYERSY